MSEHTEQAALIRWTAYHPDKRLDVLRQGYNDATGEFDRRFATMRDAELLVIDDLGTQSATPWAREKLYQIVNWRYRGRGNDEQLV